jgi:hypothetical protein
MDFSNKTVLIVDNGLFTELAVTLSKSFGRVLYFFPWMGAFPKSNSMMIGTGIPGVERIRNFWDYTDEADLIVFPDIYAGDWQKQLVSQGKRVWGSRDGDELELYRKESKEHLKKIGLDIGKYAIIKGLDDLRKHLKDHKKQYVKVSTTRGDFETFYAKTYKLIEPRLDELELMLGAKKKGMEFIVEDAIEDAVEIGYDGFTVDGQFPNQSMCGIEIKDMGYVGYFKDYKDMPKQVIEVNSKISPTLKEYEYKNFFCCEMRITRDGTPWIIDPMTRFGSPPSELIMNMYTNLDEILWMGAEGVCVDPIPEAKFGAELLIHSTWADKNWQAVDFPMEIRDNIKFRNLTIIDGRYYVVPQSVGLPEIGAVVATGNTEKEAIDKVKELATQIEGYSIETYPDSLDKAGEEKEKLKQFGIEL